MRVLIFARLLMVLGAYEDLDLVRRMEDQAETDQEDVAVVMDVTREILMMIVSNDAVELHADGAVAAEEMTVTAMGLIVVDGDAEDVRMEVGGASTTTMKMSPEGGSSR